MRSLLIALAAVLGLSSLTQAQTPEAFYKGRTTSLVMGTGPGGSYDLYGRLIATHLPRFITGQPTMIVEHMPGAGGVNSINYLANAAPKDGTVIAVAMPNFFVTPYVQPSATRFDPKGFRFIGRMGDFGRALATWTASGARTVDDLRKKTITVGASSLQSTTSVAPILMNEMLGTKMNVIQGYIGSGPTLLALERGEVDSLTVAWSTLKSERPHWLREKKITIVAGLDFNQVPIDDAPRVRDLIGDPEQRAIWDFVALPAEFGTSFLVPPGVPEERLGILRKAFDEAMRSPEMVADAKKRQLDIDPRGGAELDAMFVKYGVPTPAIVATVSRVMGVGQ